MALNKHMQQRGDFSANRRLLLLLALATVIGGISAYVAKLLLAMIRLFTQIFYYGTFSFADARPSDAHWGIYFIFVPVVGSLIIGFMARYGSEKIRGHGIPEALEAILFGKSMMDPKVAVLKPISSAISIGSGGPFGAEGPIIMTGGAVGSILAQCFHLTAAERKTLLTAGAAAGMSAVFNTPIAAVFLAVELLLFEWKPRSIIPVAFASATAALVRMNILGAGPLFASSILFNTDSLSLAEALFSGLVAGLFSTALSKTLYWLEDAFHKLPFHWMWWPAIGGLVVGIGGYFDPRALGVGYDLIGGFLNGNMTNISLLLSVKVVIWLVALASGTSGGVLAPLLIFGCALGSIESRWFVGANPAAWSLISMGAIMGGMMRSPFTAILFAFELTHSADSLLPLMVASFCSYAVTVLIMKRSILTEKVARRGYDIFREYDVDPLERLSVKEVMTSQPKTILADIPVAKLIEEVFGRGKHNGYPVLAANGTLLGIITSSDLERIPALDKIEKLTAKDLIQRPPVVALPFESSRIAADRMAEHGVGRLLVTDPETHALIGIVTRADLLKARAASRHEEMEKERVFTFRKDNK
ncbi:MAG: chloride channel protein [Bdellovibrionota bacterium]